MVLKFSRTQVFRMALTLTLFFCVLFANFYAVKRMEHYGLRLYFYDKLLVAYNVGGERGMKGELQEVLSYGKSRAVYPLAKEFNSLIAGLEDPRGYLEGKVAENRDKIFLFKNLRLAAVILMLFILAWRLIVNLRKNRRQNQKQGNS